MKVMQALDSEATSARQSLKISKDSRTRWGKQDRVRQSTHRSIRGPTQISTLWTIHFAPGPGQDAGKERSQPTGRPALGLWHCEHGASNPMQGPVLLYPVCLQFPRTGLTGTPQHHGAGHQSPPVIMPHAPRFMLLSPCSIAVSHSTSA